MNKNYNIQHIHAINICQYCGGHFRTRYPKHTLCRPCYWGAVASRATRKAAEALKEAYK